MASVRTFQIWFRFKYFQGSSKRKIKDARAVLPLFSASNSVVSGCSEEYGRKQSGLAKWIDASRFWPSLLKFKIFRSALNTIYEQIDFSAGISHNVNKLWPIFFYSIYKTNKTNKTIFEWSVLDRCLATTVFSLSYAPPILFICLTCSNNSSGVSGFQSVIALPVKIKRSLAGPSLPMMTFTAKSKTARSGDWGRFAQLLFQTRQSYQG